jgi:hypothetical protein
MSSTDTSPRSGAKKPKSAEEIGGADRRAALAASKSDIDDHAHRRQASQEHAGKPGDGDPEQTRSQQSASPSVSAFFTR